MKQFNDYDDNRIYAGDETGIDGDISRRKKTLTAKGRKRAQIKGKRYSSHTSFLCIGNAAGESLPPIVIHKGERIDADKAQQLPSNALIGCHSSGYFIKDHFIQVLQHLNQHATAARPILLIIDGAKTHIDLSAIEYAIEHQICILCIPANTSHILQVHDVSVFHPFKQAYRQLCYQTKKERQRGNIPKEIRSSDIIPLAMQAMSLTITADNLKAGFKKTGIRPYDPQIYKTSIPPPIQYTSSLAMLTSLVQQQSSTSNTNTTPIVPPVVSNLVSNFSLPSDDAHPPSDNCPTVRYRHRTYT